MTWAKTLLRPLSCPDLPASDKPGSGISIQSKGLLAAISVGTKNTVSVARGTLPLFQTSNLPPYSTITPPTWTHQPTYPPTIPLTCWPTYSPTELPSYLPAYLPTCLPTYLPTYYHTLTRTSCQCNCKTTSRHLHIPRCTCQCTHFKMSCQHIQPHHARHAMFLTSVTAVISKIMIALR